ncbi:LD-carboxypeptidase [Ostertagia ostertagi]
MLDDDSINAILCGRGGYGLGRIIDQLDFSLFKKKPKWIIGFSDITVLHQHIYSNYKIATLHAPMAAAFNDGGAEGEFVQSLKNALEGKKARYECAVHDFNRRGEAVGELVGGNLTLVSHLVGTSSESKTKGRILFLEDTGELLYKVDRMLYQLKRSGMLEKLAGLIIGGFSDMSDTERPFGKTVYEIVQDIVKEYDYPVCYNFPVSHSKENYALKVGMVLERHCGESRVLPFPLAAASSAAAFVFLDGAGETLRRKPGAAVSIGRSVLRGCVCVFSGCWRDTAEKAKYNPLQV